MKKYRVALIPFIMFYYWLGCGGIDSSLSEHSDSQRISQKAFQWDREGCSTWRDPVNLNQIDFCFKSTRATNITGQTGKTLYAFHGMGGTPKDFCNQITHLRSSFERLRSISHVICPSFGPYWSIHENKRNESFARFQVFMQQTEGASSILKPVLYGESMGGFNAIKLSGAVHSHVPEFQKVGVSCPAIFSKRLPTRYHGSQLPPSLFGSFDPETSLSIIQDSPYFDSSATYPELYIFANLDDPIGRDNFSIDGILSINLGGIYQGARDFYSSLKERGLIVHFKDLPGGHCAEIPREDMMDFLGE